MQTQEDKLWALIRFYKKATPKQIKAWCQELIAMGSPSKSDEVILKEVIQELDLAQEHIDIAYKQIRLLLSRIAQKEVKKKGKPSK